MGGTVIQTLRASPLATSLTEAELRALASCGRLQEYLPGQIILEADVRPANMCRHWPRRSRRWTLRTR